MKKILFLFCFLLCQLPTANCQLLDSAALAQQKTFFSLQDALLKPDSVFKLNLSKKKLKEVPPQVFQFKNLQVLNLSKNSLKEIPPQIGQLKNLQNFNAASNNLKRIPPEIGSLINLVHINFNRNLIEAIPFEIGNLSNLEIFEMWDNELDTIPDEIKNLHNLRVLELRGILFSEEDQRYVKKLLPNCKVYFSPSCACANKF
ncbi:MAG: leucine-rich repeat domain-containing protein [Bacteroidia bacterium]